jgi:WD40 repeat protein
VTIWNATTLTQIGEIDEHSNAVLALAFSSDAKLLLSGAADESLRLCDVESR